jgi:hypothetical protein
MVASIAVAGFAIGAPEVHGDTTGLAAVASLIICCVVFFGMMRSIDEFAS